MDIKKLVQEMKSKGIETALLKNDGGVVYSTFGMDDPAPSISEYLANNAHHLMAELGDEAKEIELSFEGKMLVMVPLGKYLLLAIVTSKESKKEFRQYVESIKSAFF